MDKLKEKFDIENRVAVITGGAGMLAREYAKALLEYGAKVVLVDIQEDKGGDAVREVNEAVDGDVRFIKTDITQKESIDDMVKTVLEIFGKIDILINNAALDPKFAGQKALHHYTFEDYPLDLWNQSVAVNLTGAFLCSQAIGRFMKKSGGGVIVNVASELGVIAPDQRIYKKENEPEQTQYKPVDYPVTKAALIHLTKYLASYWGENNIRVNSLCPAAVKAGQDDVLSQHICDRTVLGRMSQKDEFNGAILFLVSDASSYMTGANLIIDGGRTIW